MTNLTLTDLGWSDQFAAHLEEGETRTPVRITAVHRASLDFLGPDGPGTLIPGAPAGDYAVGDWVLSDGTHATPPLPRLTAISRRAAGHEAKPQLIAANVDTLGIVTSCNDDFNVARLERYLALAAQGGCLPLVILTKADRTNDARDYQKQAERLSPMLTAIALNAKDPEEVERLAPWCSAGQTLALVGSSGVGKTTLQNALTGLNEATQDIREDDAKGRHTTTGRALRPTLHGGWLIDTPGIRELRLWDVEEGIEEVFSDVIDLAANCRFRDCAHEAEPGCAVRDAIEEGTLDPARLTRWRKLEAENRHNNATVAEQRARGKSLNKLYKEGKARSKHKRDYSSD